MDEPKFDGITFPKGIDKFVNQNVNINVGVFCCDGAIMNELELNTPILERRDDIPKDLRGLSG